MSRIGTMGIALSIVLIGASCNLQREAPPEDEVGGSYGAGLLDSLEEDLPASQRQVQQPGQAGAPQVHSRPATPLPGEDAPRELGTASRPNDFVGTGMLAPFYLRGSTPRLVIEINAVSGFTPSQSALNVLRDRLGSVVDKQGGIEILPANTIREGKPAYTLQDVREIEDRHRTRYSTNEVATIHVLYLNGQLTDGSALGVAYTGSAVAIFAEQVERASTPLVPAERIEQAVLVHEIGHLLSLVNLVYKSPRDHEDPEHPGHSKHRSSVMYWAVESLSVASVLTGGPPTDFSADDRADLEDVKAGRLMGSS